MNSENTCLSPYGCSSFFNTEISFMYHDAIAYIKLSVFIICSIFLPIIFDIMTSTVNLMRLRRQQARGLTRKWVSLMMEMKRRKLKI